MFLKHLKKKKTTEGYKSEEMGWKGNWVIGPEEGSCGDKHWVLHATNESLNTTSEINDVVYVG